MTTTAGRGEGSEARRASLRSSVQQEAGDPQHAAKSSATGQSSYSFARKRAYKRAVRRAGRDGFAHYRGRVMQPHELRARYVPNSSQNQGFPVQPVRRANGQAPASIRIMTWNCGGYSTLKDELYTWLDACDCDVVCLQETWLQNCMEFVAGDWTCVHCGTGPSKARGQAGVMILLRRSAFDSNTVRYNHVIGGRLLHVRAQCKAGWIDIVGVYMHAWAGKDKEQEIIAARSRVWTALRTTLGHIPKGNQLLLCGDFNSVLRPQQPFLGQGMGEKVTNFAADSSDFVSVLHDFDLLAVNTFGKRSNYTHILDGHAQKFRSFLDYVLVRRKGTTLRATFKILADFPVARWRGGGRHLPVTMQLHFRRFQFAQSRPNRLWPQWKCRLLGERIAHRGPDTQAYIAEVTDSLKALCSFSPSQVNQVLLDAGQRHFHISRPSSLTPPWQDAQHIGTIRDMWTQYKLAQRQFQYCASGLRACFRSWRYHTRFQAMHRTVRRNSRLLRRRRFDELLHQAEAKDYHGRVDCLFALLRQHAPKQPRVRAQLRSSSGALLMPQEEARELADYWKGVTTAASPTCAPQATDFDLDVNEVVGAIQQLPANKAAPAHYAPHALWKLVAEPVGQLLDRSLLQEWREHQADIPAHWADAWLTFLQKAHKAGNKPEHLRPIALLDPVGKAVSGILRQQLDPYIRPHMEERHQYGFLPLRSTQQALGQVFMHCRQVRARCQALKRSLYERRAGQHSAGCAGGMQLSIDLTQAFDRIDRSLLEKALLHIGVPAGLRSLLLRWVHAGHYVVACGGHQRRFATSQGIRQGCKLSPSLWNCIIIYVTHVMEQRLGHQWCKPHLIGFADDNLYRWSFEQLSDVQAAIREASIILQTLGELGLQVSKDKTVVLFKLAGSQSEACRRKVVCKIDGKVHLRLHPDLAIPIKAQHTYLGAIISFGRYEDLNADHRCQAGLATYHRLRKHLHSKRTWPLHKRLRLWQAYVIPSVFYSLTASGLTEKGAAQVRVELLRQLRAIAGQPRHLTLESDVQFLSNIGMQAPLEMLAVRQQGVLDRTQDLKHQLNSADVRLDPTLEAHERAVLHELQNLLDPDVRGNGSADLPCPDCGKCFPTSASLRQHRAKVHRSGANKAAGERFDRLLHGKDGMPQCVNCGHKFRLWEELQRHVQLGRCQAATRVDYDDVQAPLLARVLDQRIQFPEVFFQAPSGELRKELMEHCAICRQWLPNENYMKVHYGRVHKEEWQAHHARIRVWCVNNLPAVKGQCGWCGHKAQQGRDHRATCPALFQLAMTWFIDGGPSLAEQPIALAAPFPTPEDVKGYCTTCQFCSASLAKQRYRTHLQRHHSDIWRDMQPSVQLMCASWTGSVRQPCQLCGAKSIKKAEHVHTCVPLLQYALLHCVRSRDDHGYGDRGHVRTLPPGSCGGHEAGAGPFGSRSADRPGGAEAATSRNHHQVGGEGMGTPRVTQQVPRRRSETRTRQTQQGQCESRATGHGPVPYDAEARTGNPAAAHRQTVLFAHGVRAAGDARGLLAGSPDLAGRQEQDTANDHMLIESHTDPLHDVGVGKTPARNVPKRGDSQGHGQARDGEDRHRSHVELPGVEPGQSQTRDRCQQTAYPQHPAFGGGQGTAGSSAQGSRELDSSFPLHEKIDRKDSGRHLAIRPGCEHEGGGCKSGLRATSAAGGERFAQSDRGTTSGRARSALAHGSTSREATGTAGALIATEVLKSSFSQGGRYSYMHASTMAWLMAGADYFTLAYTAGHLAHPIKSFLTVGSAFRLPSSLPWRPYLSTWELRRDADVALWLQHALSQALSAAFDGAWEAREAQEGTVKTIMRNSTHDPLVLLAPSEAPLAPSGNSVGFAALLSAWTHQTVPCALVRVPDIFCIVLHRCAGTAAGEICIITDAKSPTSVLMPCYDCDMCTATHTVPYMVASVIVRSHAQGSEQYRARYWGHSAKEGWYTHPDGKPAKLLKPSEIRLFARDCAAIYLRRAGESAIGSTA